MAVSPLRNAVSYGGRSTSIAAALAALVASACSPESQSQHAVGRPDVVIVLLDALHAAHLGHLGYELDTTPNIDALAADGISFSAAFAPAPYTLASIPSLLTGRLPDTHGVTRPGDALAPEETTIAELLGAAGYRTHAAVANLQGSAIHALEQGFDDYREIFRPPGKQGVGVRMPTAADFVPIVAEWIAARGDEPVLYYLHILEPHVPYDPPAEYRERFLDPSYDGRYKDGVTMELMEGGQSAEKWIKRVHHDPVRQLYDANLAWADHNVGVVFDLLREAGMYEDALVILTSDHGEAFWQHGRWGHSTQVYDEMLRIPLVVKLPGTGGVRGAQVDGLASLTDVVPSLCEWLDLPPPVAPLDGVSLADSVADPRRAPGDAGGRELFLRSFHAQPTLALRSNDSKTILEREDGGARGDVEHYDLRRDPGEKDDLGATARGTSDADRLELWIGEATRAQASRGRELTEDERELLEQLGYVE